jgi:hypothetical protein
MMTNKKLLRIMFYDPERGWVRDTITVEEKHSSSRQLKKVGQYPQRSR